MCRQNELDEHWQLLRLSYQWLITNDDCEKEKSNRYEASRVGGDDIKIFFHEFLLVVVVSLGVGGAESGLTYLLYSRIQVEMFHL